MKKAKKGRALSALLLVLLLLSGCAGGGKENYPAEPDTPAPDPHRGTFVSEHGSLTFNGDGTSVVLDLDDVLAGLTGLPEGESEGTYDFLSGDLPPQGSFPVRYDIAHEMRITVGGSSAVIGIGIASADGSSAQAGWYTVTPDRIPLLFEQDGKNFTVTFSRSGAADE